MQKEELIKEIQSYFEGTNPCHDFLHTERVLNLALHLGEQEGADLEIIELAALLHDIARKEQDESKGEICHAEKGAEIARQILKQKGLEEEKINKVIHCIATHRFRDNKAPESKEAKILYDADKLDSIGAIGIGRAFSFSGHLGALVHKEHQETDQDYSKEDTANREFIVKLNKVKDKMLTQSAKQLAQQRHNFMTEFFDRLGKEVKGEL